MEVLLEQEVLVTVLEVALAEPKHLRMVILVDRLKDREAHSEEAQGMV